MTDRPLKGRHAVAGSLGFTLVETLVAIVIVGTGFLAWSQLLLVSARQAQAGELRLAATLLADDLAEQLRADPRSAGATGGQGPSGMESPNAGAAESLLCAQRCDADQFARAAIARWHARVARRLPGGRGRVVFNPAAAGAQGTGRGTVDLWIGWNEPLAAGREERSAARSCALEGSPIGGPARDCLHRAVGL